MYRNQKGCIMFKGEKTLPLVSETGKENESYKYQNRWAKSVLVTNDVTMYTEIKRINRKMITTTGSNT